MSPLSNNNASQSDSNQISSNSAFKPLMSEPRQLITMSSSVSNEQYTDLGAYSSYSQMNTTTQEYHSNQQLSLSAFKRDQHHEDIAGFSYPRPVKLYEHPIEPYSPNQTVYRNDAPSPGASIIDLSTSSVTSLRSQGFSSSAYFEGQRYDRSPQLASSPHYSSPQMLSPQGHTLDLSVGRTQMG